MHGRLALTLTSSLLACGGGGETTGFGGGGLPGNTEVVGSSGAAESSNGVGPGDGGRSTSEAGDGSMSAGESDGFLWDMGAPDVGGLQPAGCGGKIDFLFLISSLGTMKNQQEKLLASFPGFMQAIEAQYPGFDRHILVANLNPQYEWQLTDCSLCKEDCDPHAEPPFCGAELTNCDKKMGAGVTFPAGLEASNRRCELAGGHRYITSAEDNVTEAFACIAQVGIGGANSAGQAMVEALRPSINDPDDEDACNRGFLRDDALLVVTIIVDTYDQTSQWTVEEWIEHLRAAKQDDDDAFAVLVLTTDVDLGYGHLCHPDKFSKTPNRLRQLVQGVEHGFIGSICEPSYTPFFAENVGGLVELCEGFVPPG